MKHRNALLAVSIVAIALFSLALSALMAQSQPTPSDPERPPSGAQASAQSRTPALSATTSVQTEPPRDSPPTAEVAKSSRELVITAKAVLAIGDVGEVAYRQPFGVGIPSQKKSQERIEKELRKWGRFTLVVDPTQADLIVVLLEGNRFLKGGYGPYSELLVFQGGKLPAKYEKPLWQTDAMWSVGSAVGKVVERFRKHIEELERATPTVAQIAQQPVAPQAARPPEAASRPTEHVETPAQSAVVSMATAAVPVKPAAVTGLFDPMEVIRQAKTVAVVALGPKSASGFWAEAGKGFKPASAPRAKKEVEEELRQWNRYRLIDDPRQADLVFEISEWNVEREASIFHSVDYRPWDRLNVLRGGAALDLNEAPIWTSGADIQGAKRPVQLLREDVVRSSNGSATVSAQDAKDAEKSFQRAQELFRNQHEPDIAIGMFRDSLHKNWSKAEVHEHLSVALAAEGHFVSGAYELRQAVERNPDNHRTRNLLGRTLANLGDPNQAVLQYREALRLEPNNQEDRQLLVAVLEKKHHRSSTTSELQPVNLKFGDWEYHNLLGHSLEELGLVEPAVAEYRQSVELQAGNAHSHDDLGCALLVLGQAGTAAAEFQQALNIQPDYAIAYFDLGRALQLKGEQQRALEAFRQAYTLSPNNPDFKAKYEEVRRQN